MFRGYDSSDTFCEDMLLRIKDLYEEIGTIQKSMEKIKLEPLISKKSIQKLKQIRLSLGALKSVTTTPTVSDGRFVAAQLN